MYEPLLALLAPGRQFRFLLRAVLSAALVLGASATYAQRVIYGLGTLVRPIASNNIYFPSPSGIAAGRQGIVPFDPASGFPITTPLLITGVAANQLLVGIDYRPNTGELYGLGYDTTTTVTATGRVGSGVAQLYLLSPAAGAAPVPTSPTPSPPTPSVATPVGGPLALNLGRFDRQPRIGFDFNPTVDRIRVVGTNRTNYRLNPVTGAVAVTDTNLAYAVGDVNASRTPTVGAAAYTNSFIGSTSTLLYDLDEDGGGSILDTQNPPNGGTLNTVGGIRLGSAGAGGATLNLDIYSNGTTNTAYLSEVTEPTTTTTSTTFGLSSSNLYTLNLSTGQATLINNIVPRSSQSPFNIIDIAALILPPVCDAATSPTVSNLTSTGATVNFTGSPSATSYTVTTSPATTTQTLPGMATSVSFTGLTPSTTYTVSIVSNCFGGLITSSPLTASFTTLAPPNPLISVRQGVTTIANGSSYSGFANTLVGSTSAPVTFTISNNSSTDNLAIAGITTTGDFAFSGTVPTTLAPGTTSTFTLTFTPTAAGTRTGTVSITNNSQANNPYVINLSGQGIANPQIAVSQGATAIPNGGSFSGFASTTVGSTSAPVTFTITNASPTSALTLGAFTLSGPFALSGAAPTSVPAGSSATFALTFTPTATGTNPGSVSIANNSQTNNPYLINLSGQGTATAPTDLVVADTRTIQGTYRNVTVLGPNTTTGPPTTGQATLSGPLTVTGALVVQPGGTLIQACQLISGSGSFELQAGAALTICDPAGIVAGTAPSGAVRVTGGRIFSPGASYLYNGTVAQVTGAGLPSQVLTLGVQNTANVTLSQAVGVAQVLRLQAGNLLTSGLTLTLLSSAAGTALVDNSGGLVVGEAIAQRYIASSNSGLGYRHYSAPTTNANASSPNSKVADLNTSGFGVEISQGAAYNGAADPTQVTINPFPNVYKYNETRVITNVPANGSRDFDRGFEVPGSVLEPLETTRGYTVNIAASPLVDFVGTLNTGPYSATGLTRGGLPQSGWQLRGNPYPSPLNWSSIVNGGRAVNIENALYVFKSTGQYSGNYTTFVNGQSTNNGTNILPLGQGFLVRTVAGQTGSIAFTNGDRLTTFDATPFQRSTTDTRPQLKLALGNAITSTQMAVYFEQGATAGFDRAFDGHTLPAPSGLLLATETPTAEPLSINGQPALTGADVLIPLQVASVTAGAHTLRVDNLANLPTPYHAYLRDALTGTYTDLATTPSLALTLAANGPAGGRYALLFTTQNRALATAPAALARLASVYPNPTHGAATLLLPVALRGTQATAVSVVDNLGRTVLTRTLAASAVETLELPLSGLATGVYSVQAHTALGLVVKRLVVQ